MNLDNAVLALLDVASEPGFSMGLEGEAFADPSAPGSRSGGVHIRILPPVPFATAAGGQIAHHADRSPAGVETAAAISIDAAEMPPGAPAPRTLLAATYVPAYAGPWSAAAWAAFWRRPTIRVAETNYPIFE